VHNIYFPEKKGGFARSAGCGAQIVAKDHKHCRLRLSSGEYRLFPLKTEATLGVVSNSSYKLINLGKAGRSRWLNKRPSVRGVAMNPIDHPHGGGEGKSSGGRPSVTPWGKITKGQPTRKNKKK
jgi:large subunit ribosomal protein L2